MTVLYLQLIFGDAFLFILRSFINVLQDFQLFCEYSLLTISFVWLRHLCNV